MFIMSVLNECKIKNFKVQKINLEGVDSKPMIEKEIQGNKFLSTAHVNIVVKLRSILSLKSRYQIEKIAQSILKF